MAITPRTILTSAAPATVAVVSLYFFTVLGTTAFTCFTNANQATDDVQEFSVERDKPPLLFQSNACDHVAQQFESDRSQWSEFAWISYAHCYDQRDESRMVLQTTRMALDYYPNSEILHNLKGYHKIVTEDYAGAIDTLRDGMDAVAHHRNGVMANNLAWAGLWEPRMMHLDEARQLYVKSLALSPHICESVHTGLFVEFAIAKQSSSVINRADALQRFHDLRNRYNRCLDRIEDGEWHTIVEIAGAAVLFDNVDNTANTDEVHPLMSTAVAALARHHGDASVDDLCSEAMPLADMHHDCVQAVEHAIDSDATISQRLNERNKRAAQAHDQLVGEYQPTPCFRSTISSNAD